MNDAARDFPQSDPAFGASGREPAGGIGRGKHAPFSRPDHLRRFETTMGLLRPVSGKKVLDVGCGPGAYSIYLWRRGAKVTGIDLAAAAIEQALAGARDAGWAEPDFRVANALDFTGEPPYDAAIAIGVFDRLDPGVRAPFLRHLVDLCPGPVIATFPKWFAPQSVVRRLASLGRGTPVYCYRASDIAALAGAVHRLPLVVNGGPAWTVSFARTS